MRSCARRVSNAGWPCQFIRLTQTHGPPNSGWANTAPSVAVTAAVTQCSSVHDGGKAAPDAQVRRPCAVVTDAAAASAGCVRAILCGLQTRHSCSALPPRATRATLDTARCHPRCRRAPAPAGQARPPASGVAAEPMLAAASLWHGCRGSALPQCLLRCRNHHTGADGAATRARRPAHNARIRRHNYSVGCWRLPVVQYWCQQYIGMVPVGMALCLRVAATHAARHRSTLRTAVAVT